MIIIASLGTGRMQRLASAFGGSRLFRFVTNPWTRLTVRAGRTVAFAGAIGFAGYASGVHDALNDPDALKRQMLAKVLTSQGKDTRIQPADSPDSLLLTRLGNEIVAAAQHALDLERERLISDGSKEAKAKLEVLERQRRSLNHNWRFVVIDSDAVNAFVTDTLPGFVFINRGLLEVMQRDAEQLSFILGHELSHHILRHNEQDRNLQAGISLLQLLVLVTVDPTGLVCHLCAHRRWHVHASMTGTRVSHPCWHDVQRHLPPSDAFHDHCGRCHR